MYFLNYFFLCAGMRWRSEGEVIQGKGQFVCGNINCMVDDGLTSFEVPFKYLEHEIVKRELVKVRVCDKCAKKLFYGKIRTLESKKNDSNIDEHVNKVARHNEGEKESKNCTIETKECFQDLIL